MWLGGGWVVEPRLKSTGSKRGCLPVLREPRSVYGRHLIAGVLSSDVSPREHLFPPRVK